MDEQEETTPKRGRGRPKGSVNHVRAGGARVFAALAERHGYDVGEFTAVYMGHMGKALVEQSKLAARGLLFGAEKEMFMKEAAQYLRDERELLNYVYPKLRSTEEDVKVDGSLVVNIKRFTPDNDGD